MKNVELRTGDTHMITSPSTALRTASVFSVPSVANSWFLLIDPSAEPALSEAERGRDDVVTTEYRIQESEERTGFLSSQE